MFIIFLHCKNSSITGDQRSDGTWTGGKREIQKTVQSPTPGRHGKQSEGLGLILKSKLANKQKGSAN